MVPGAGIEPAYHIVVRDFKSQFYLRQKEHNFNVLIMREILPAYLVILGKICSAVQDSFGTGFGS
jgi:hypothetical protein